MEVKDIKEVRPITWVALSTFILATILPGIMILFMFCRDLFIQLDIIKISLLSMAITAPIWLINSGYVYSVCEDGGKETEGELMQMCAFAGSLLSILPLYTPICLKIFVDISPNIGFIIIASIEIITIAILIIKKIKMIKAG
nr:MAG TPA: hypothetical protein [Caudoviricetes sp.]